MAKITLHTYAGNGTIGIRAGVTHLRRVFLAILLIPFSRSFRATFVDPKSGSGFSAGNSPSFFYLRSSSNSPLESLTLSVAREFVVVLRPAVSSSVRPLEERGRWIRKSRSSSSLLFSFFLLQPRSFRPQSRLGRSTSGNLRVTQPTKKLSLRKLNMYIVVIKEAV